MGELLQNGEYWLTKTMDGDDDDGKGDSIINEIERGDKLKKNGKTILKC